MKNALLLLAAFCLSGCAHYEYNLLAPVSLARHIGPTTQAVVSDDPLVYRMETVENHLIVWIDNPTTDPIMIVGEKSVLVDPLNQSHPFMSQTIAPGSHIKIILPPPPWVYADADTGAEQPVYLYVGGGMHGGYRGYYGYHGGLYYRRGFYYGGPFYGPYYDDYPYYWDYPYDGDPLVANPDYFPWSADREVRMILTFSRAGKEFQQTLVFDREKVK